MGKELIDYALPLLQTDVAVKRVYDKMLEGNPQAAMEYAHEAHRSLLDAMLMIRAEIVKGLDKS